MDNEQQPVQDWVGPAIQNLLNLFVKPEVERRHKLGLLPTPFELFSAQIVFFADGRQPIVRLNEEVQAVGYVKLKPGVAKEKGDLLREDEIQELRYVRLPPDADPDCGHATIMRLGDRWGLNFDFIYNKGLSAQHIRSAEEFFATAEEARAQHRLAPYLDSLFNAAELACRSILLSAPDPEFVKKGSHHTIHSRMNMEAKAGNVDPELVSAYNTLYSRRVDARYRPQSVALEDAEADKLQEAVSALIELARQRIARPEPS